MRVLILTNYVMGLISFRKEVVEAIVAAGHQLIISVPYDERITELEALGAECVVTDMDRRSTNPFKDIGLLGRYVGLIRKVKPHVVLTYTIKPNVYGGLACRLCGVPQVANVTGLGTALENPGVLQRFITGLYRIGLGKAHKVFFQNVVNRDFCLSRKMVPDRTRVIPGSGVNLMKFRCCDYPNDGVTRFLYIGRLMRDKGTQELFDVAQAIRKMRHDVEFHIVGFCEELFGEKLKELVADGVIVFHGQQKDVRPYIAQSSCLIHPSYHEGMSNVILESCASGRPVITTDANGCRDAVEDGVTGLLAKVRDANDLHAKVQQFLNMSWEQKKEMGMAARRKMEREFDRNIVIRAYMDAIEALDHV